MKQIAKQKAKEERKKLEAEVRVVCFERIRASLYALLFRAVPLYLISLS